MEHSVKEQINWSWKFIQPYRFSSVGFLSSELISLFFGLFFIWMSKRAIDAAIHGDPQTVTESLYWVAISLFISFLANLLGNRLNERTKAKMLIDLQNQIASRQMHAQWMQTSDWHTGELLVRANADSQETVQALGNIWISTIITLVRILAALALLYWMDPLLALILLGACPLILLSKSFFRKLRKLNRSLKEREGELGKVMQENFRNRLFIRSVNWETKRWQKVLDSQNAIYLKKLNLLDFSTFSRGTLGVVMQLSYLITFIWGVSKLQSSEITFGTMSAFLQLVGRIQGPLVTLMGYVPLMVRFRSSLDRVMEVLNVPVEQKTPQKKLDAIDRLCLRNVTFRYGKESFIKDLSMEFHKGVPVAIFAPSGKGKTTLLRILMGLFPTETGEVLLQKDDQLWPISEALRCNFAYVPQGDKLLSGTIGDNLGINNTEHTEFEIQDALSLACAEFIYSLPMGLDTLVGEGGYGLSEGQAQRIGVARAILQNSSVWLFDEITSALDDSTARRLVTNLIDRGKDKVIIFVSHDRALNEMCKIIYTIE